MQPWPPGQEADTPMHILPFRLAVDSGPVGRLVQDRSGSERWGPFDSLESVKGRNCGLTPCTKCSQTFICWLACLSVGGSTTQRKGRGNPLHTGYLVETEVSSFKETWGLGRSQGGGRGRPQTRTCSFTILPSEKHYLTPILLGSGEAVFIEQK